MSFQESVHVQRKPLQQKGISHFPMFVSADHDLPKQRCPWVVLQQETQHFGGSLACVGARNDRPQSSRCFRRNHALSDALSAQRAPEPSPSLSGSRADDCGFPSGKPHGRGIRAMRLCRRSCGARRASDSVWCFFSARIMLACPKTSVDSHLIVF